MTKPVSVTPNRATLQKRFLRERRLQQFNVPHSPIFKELNCYNKNEVLLENVYFLKNTFLLLLYGGRS